MTWGLQLLGGQGPMGDLVRDPVLLRVGLQITLYHRSAPEILPPGPVRDPVWCL